MRLVRGRGRHTPLLAIGLLLLGCGTRPRFCVVPPGAEANEGRLDLAALPQTDEWIDVGLVIDAGEAGAWDFIMEGYTPSSIVRRDGRYYLYYVGADDYIADLRNLGPAHRSLGVAVSDDGIEWQKPVNRPVITFTASGNPEEGAVSAGIMTDANGTLLAFYGANIAADRATNQVNANIHLATSEDGLNFTPMGKVIDRYEAVPRRMGDEIHAAAALLSDSTYYVYFVPNGGPYSGTLRYCRGADPSALDDCGESLRSGGRPSIVPIGEDTYAFVVASNVYEVHRQCLTSFGDPVASFPPGPAIFALDPERRSWLMYYDRWSHIGMMVAPAGPIDITPPSVPPRHIGEAVAYDRIRTTWDPASDPDTGVLWYNVYRDGERVGTTRTSMFELSDLYERTTYAIEVRAVNLHGLEGAGSSVSVRTPADRQPPEVETVTASAIGEVEVRFDEPVAQSGTEWSRAFVINNDVRVTSATIGDAPNAIVLTTSAMEPEVLHTLTFTDVADRAGAANSASATVSFTPSVAHGLIAYWSFDDLSWLGIDRSGAYHNATPFGDVRGVSGKVSGALELTGEGYMEVAPTALLDGTLTSDFTVSAWVRPADLPSATDNTDGAYAIFSGPGRSDPLWLLYRSDGSFLAGTRRSTAESELVSAPFAPGAWHHVAMVADRSAATLSLYVDGALAQAAALGDSTLRSMERLESPSHAAYFGRYRLGVNSPRFALESYFFRGALDEIRIYRSALSQEEVRQIMGTPTG